MLNPHLDGLDPFAATVRGITEPDPVHAALRAAGPLVEVDAPAGGQAWIVTDDALAREVLTDPRVAKDPAFAPPGGIGTPRDLSRPPPSSRPSPPLTAPNTPTYDGPTPRSSTPNGSMSSPIGSTRSPGRCSPNSPPTARRST